MHQNKAFQTKMTHYDPNKFNMKYQNEALETKARQNKNVIMKNTKRSQYKPKADTAN